MMEAERRGAIAIVQARDDGDVDSAIAVEGKSNHLNTF